MAVLIDDRRLGARTAIRLRVEECVRRQDACARFTEKEDAVGLLVEIRNLLWRALDGGRICRPQFLAVLDMKAKAP